MLRRPMEREEHIRQRGLIRLAGDREALRLRIQLLLSGIGRGRHIDLTEVFHPTDTSSFRLALYIALDLILALAVLAVALLGVRYVLIAAVPFLFNPIFPEFRRTRYEHEIARVNYCVSLALALKKMRKWADRDLDVYLKDAYSHLDRMKPILRAGPVMSGLNSDPFQAAVMNFFLLDLISFEILKKRLNRYHDHFLAVHEAVGRLDAAVAAASFRQSMTTWCEPEIEFDAERPFIRAEGVVHPLLEGAVPNDLSLEGSLLITGSNASGKSTFLRASALCALLAETLCTCPCGTYRGSFFRIYTSMALSDDLMSGESYFIAEIRSIKRVLDAQKEEGFILCVLDEVLRGTNTVERIAASAEILSALAGKNTLCLAATHDQELCGLTSGRYQAAHFEETVTDEGVAFDYRLKPGPARSRNAILLLKVMGFDQSIADAAHERADAYMKTGKWTK